jgi:AbrB family looped-hinge helix DNA binding protein
VAEWPVGALEGNPERRCRNMAVRISPKFQVVIPKETRDLLQLKPGTRLEVFDLDGRIKLVRVGPMREMRGSLPGIDTSVPRDKDRI